MLYKVNEIFRSIQGEGPDVGTPCIFVRLSGCNLSCPWCDTNHWEFSEMTTEEIVESVGQLAIDMGNRFVVITGGEPTIQSLGSLVGQLVQAGYTIQVETNGENWQPCLNHSKVSIICSPKEGCLIDHRLLTDVRSIAIKLVVGSKPERPYEDIARIAEIRKWESHRSDLPIFIQPRDDKSHDRTQANIMLAIELSTRYGFRLSLQTHKMIGIR